MQHLTLSLSMENETVVSNSLDAVTAASNFLLQATVQARINLKGAHKGKAGSASLRTLETSQQKFQSWKEMWNDSGGKPEVLWGEKGWEIIQDLLDSIREKTRTIVSANTLSSRPQTRIKRVFSAVHKKDRFRSATEQENQLKLALDLSESIDQLWTCSEVTFDSLHESSSGAVGPPSKEKFLQDSVRARIGCLNLYRACTNSGLDCNLEIGLRTYQPRSQSSLVNNESEPLKLPNSLSYHLHTQTRDANAESRKITLENLITVPSQDIMSVEFSYDKVDLRKFESNLKSDFISICPPNRDEPTYFRVSKPSKVTESNPIDKTLSEILREGQAGVTSDIQRPIPLKVMDLAFQLGECCFYLLGTPWLAGLSSQTVRRMEKGEARRPFVLEIRTLDVEDLALEDPEALTENRQLFRIGVLLMDIALNKSSSPVPSFSKERYWEYLKRLPSVEQSMGNEYRKATAFCLQDRSSESQFGTPDKFQKPVESGWASYLDELLRNYYYQVYVRSVIQWNTPVVEDRI